MRSMQLQRMYGVAGLTIVVSGLGAMAISTSISGTSQDRDARRSLVQREAREPARLSRRFDAGSGRSTALFPDEFRTIDGTHNNLDNPTWGAAGTPLIRMSPAAYPDGAGDVPARIDQQSGRQISNNVCAQEQSVPNTHMASAMLWQWGQFIDHDLDETPIHSPAEAFDIEVPSDDALFDPQGTGEVTIPLDRSAFIMADGTRQQLNNITSFIDASQIYGSDSVRAAELRTFDGTGRLKMSAGNLLPFNTAGLDNAPSPSASFFLAGDIRSNEQIGLLSMHTLFVREHNLWAQMIGLVFPHFDDDQRYEYARAIVAAEMQHITYNEFLPILLGPDALPSYAGYDPGVHPGIANEFAAAAFRVGHTMLSSPMLRIGGDGEPIAAGHLDLAAAFFAPNEVINHGIDPIIRGLALQHTQQIDILLVDDVRNFLFGPPGAGGFDLAALNVQRGRDHGLPAFNTVRDAYGLPPFASFSAISPDPVVQDCLSDSYADVSDIDPWIGMLAEPHAPGAMVGETLRTIIADQFTRIRDGDRFWYESYLTPGLVDMIQQQTLADVIRRNTGIGAELPDNPFIIPTICPADLTGDGVVGLDDLLEVIANWGTSGTGGGDVTGDAAVDLADLLAIISEWGLVC